MSDQNGTLNSQNHSSEQDEDDEEIELEKLEAEVNQMADKLLQYRATLPDQLKTTLASILASQRPIISTRFEDGSDPGPSVEPNLVDEENQETSEKLDLLKRKISSNASAMPIVLKRMKECISRIDKLDSLKGTIHPAFKRKRTS